MLTRSTLIARQARIFIVLAFMVVGLVIFFIDWELEFALLPLPLVLVYMFRDPQRSVPAVPLAVVSPVDGRVISVDEVHDHYLDRDAVRIRLRMNPMGVYTTRSPIEGKVVEQWYIGRDQQKAGDPAFAQWVQTDEGDDVVLTMYRSALRQRPACYLQSGERVGQGQRCGFISFGACIEVFVPANARIHIKRGQTTIAGETILAEFSK